MPSLTKCVKQKQASGPRANTSRKDASSLTTKSLMMMRRVMRMETLEMIKMMTTMTQAITTSEPSPLSA